MSNLLDKASILLTPTAYDNGRMLSVKPNENLYGSELVTNGDFATDSDWNKGTGWSISSSRANRSGIAANSYMGQDFNVEQGKKYIIKYDRTYISGNGETNIFSYFDNNSTRTTRGIYRSTIQETVTVTDTFTSNFSSNLALRIYGIGDFTGSIDNVSVKEDLSGDFQFSRNSAATRVNAQGLVENVQIISPELVSNGNFSQIGTEEVLNGNFSQEGSELITNGDFATDSDWSKLNATISGGKGNLDSSGGTSLLWQDILTNGNSYKATFTVSDYNGSGTAEVINNGGIQVYQITSNGTFTINFTHSNASGNFLFRAKIGAVFSVDNISVKEVGQNWTIENTWTIGDGVANGNGANGSGAELISNSSSLPIGTYKIVFEIKDYVSGGVIPYLLGATETFSSNGVHTVYKTITSASGLKFRGLNFNGSITNISVKEVGQDWNLGTGWSVGDGIVEANNTSSFISQSGLIEASKLYRLTFEARLKSGTNGTINAYIGGSNNQQFTIANTDWQSFTYEDTRGGSLANSIYFNNNGTELELDNISVKEITDDTNIPRINYEGFSYQDSLGSEEIVNGGFDTDSNWVKQAGWSISGGTANCDGTANNALRQNFSLPVGTLRIKFDVTTVTQGSVDVYVNTPTFTRLLGASAIGSYEVDVVTTSGADNIFFYSASNFIGSIDNVSVKEYLGQSVVPDSGCGSWLLEPQSTNLFPYSNNISVFSKASAGTGSNPIITSNYSVSPDGTMNADRIQFNRGSGTSSVDTSYIAYGLSLGTIDATLSIYLKTNDETTKDVTLRLGASLFDYDVTITPKWQRFVLSGNTNVDRVQILLYGNQNSQTADISCYGIQLEEQSYATSYIPTNGATNTRLQDIANNSGNSSLINSTEGVLYAEIAALADDVSISLSDNTFNNSISFGVYLDKISAVIRKDGGYITSGIIDTSTNAFNNNKIAIKYNSSSCDFYVNGLVVGSSSGVTYSSDVLDNLNFDRGSGHDDFFGKTKALAVYKEALTDANLRSLTYPNPVATTFDLDFDTIAEQFTFTRGSEATFVNAQGLIESTASNDAPRIDYSTGAEAFLLEGQSTNLITYSSDFSNAVWSKTDVTATSGFLAPDGTTNAFKVKKTGSNSHLVGFSGQNTGKRKSIYARTVSGTGKVSLLNVQSDTNALFDLTEQWQRFDITNSGADFFYAVDFRNTGATLSEVLIWGAQLENQSYSTSYIPTSGASATRNQELCNNATPVINSEEGTLYAEISALADDGVDKRIALSDATMNNYVSIGYSRFSGNIIAEMYSGGVLQTVDWGATGVTQTNNNKFALSWGGGTMKFYVNGTQTNIENVTSPIGMNNLRFSAASGSLNFFGNTKGLKIYPKALADVQLEDLTTI